MGQLGSHWGQSVKESLGTNAADLRLYARQGYPTFNNSKQEELALQPFCSQSDSGSTFVSVNLGPWQQPWLRLRLQSPGVKHEVCQAYLG